MRKILFLDFDGVLHRYFSGTFSKLSLLCDFLRQHMDIEIVITSTWRFQHPLVELREFFPVDLQPRIVDVTPDLSQAEGSIIVRAVSRIDEILDWLGRHPEVSHWAALDDEVRLFPTHTERLVQTDAAEGLTASDLARLVPLYS